ncbi:MAG: SPOR domain-containing protein [Bacteroidota bacterium]|nr:SPOR domain-containing protein [Bacteroidota bacterium]
MPHRQNPGGRPLRAMGFVCYALAILTLLTPSVETLAQQDSSRTIPATAVKMKPTFGLGAGMFAFYGDVGRNHAGHSALVTRFGYELRASTPITPWLEGKLYALHGRLGMNERSPERNLNFDSRITIGGFQFQYNFHQLLNPDRRVEPFINVGFESVEFLTKTDLYDARGRAYNYWSDGTIRDIPEASDNAANAVIIERDYTYESDVRELNNDGFGKYAERTWAIPVGVGARMHIGGGFDFRVGATMHYTFSDLVDGVTDQSTEARRGDSRNDRFLYSSASIGYAIPLERKQKKQPKLAPMRSEDLDIIVLNDDEDGDAVADFRDQSPHSPPGVKVDLNGCPVDGDIDRVPDHTDDEAGTELGAAVNLRGVTMTDEDHLQGYMNYIDSGNVKMEYSRRESFGPMPNKKPAPKRVYVVKVGTQVEGISEDLIQQILSIPDVRTIERNDTTYYVVGSYEAMPEALRRELELRGIGIEGMVMAEEDGKLIDISKDVVLDRAKLSGTGTFAEEKGRVTVRVQLGAFRRHMSENIFKDVTDLVTIKGDDGLSRYYTGSFTDVNQAARHKVQMLLNGFEGAFLVAFKDGKRISMKEAGAATTGTEDLRSLPSGSINKEMLRYRVQVATFAGNVPVADMGPILDIGDVQPIADQGSVRYFHGSFKTRAEADKALGTIKQKGFTDAFVVGYMGGHIINADDADHLRQQP